ncbi:alpha/beta fold hydrolase [Plantactinospora sp. KBS50]|uniref:alpha/beta fold hydrolase n=1 Tax=Plantactinospora sp. KBS50 TaxID=2024580 RepID=UPI000BAB211D|nr:alpha/beta hydrolase [Plantactinospora sp. KBS50]ASW54871.1 alpha/beta hydrolase [Plantactinospora sp. KBS50]
MTEFLNVDGGTIAYQVSGAGPLMVLVHGIGQSRDAYRFVVPDLVAAGHRVATVDLRGSGESSATWPSYTRTDIADDLIALIEHLGGPAVLVGHSISGGAATIVAAKAPSLVTAVVELAPFTRKVEYALGDLRRSRYRRGALAISAVALFGSRRQWRRYLEIATPDPRPADWAASLDRTEAMLREPGRMKALRKQMNSAADAGAQLGNVHRPVLVVMGTLDPDWGDPLAEGEAVVAALPAGVGRLEVIPGAGHYPQVQFPAKVVGLILSFLASVRA